VNGIDRRWLAHYQAHRGPAEAAARWAALPVDQVYGVVFHSSAAEQGSFTSYLELLHATDPTGSRSRTVTQIVEGDLLPIQTLTDEQANNPLRICESCQTEGCTTGTVCAPNGRCVPDCRTEAGCPPQLPTCSQETGLCS